MRILTHEMCQVHNVTNHLLVLPNSVHGPLLAATLHSQWSLRHVCNISPTRHSCWVTYTLANCRWLPTKFHAVDLAMRVSQTVTCMNWTWEVIYAAVHIFTNQCVGPLDFNVLPYYWLTTLY